MKRLSVLSAAIVFGAAACGGSSVPPTGAPAASADAGPGQRVERLVPGRRRAGDHHLSRRHRRRSRDRQAGRGDDPGVQRHPPEHPGQARGARERPAPHDHPDAARVGRRGRLRLRHRTRVRRGARKGGARRGHGSRAYDKYGWKHLRLGEVTLHVQRRPVLHARAGRGARHLLQQGDVRRRRASASPRPSRNSRRSWTPSRPTASRRSPSATSHSGPPATSVDDPLEPRRARGNGCPPVR